MVGKSDAKVILLVIEDLGPNAIEETRTPNLELLIKAGSATMEAEVGKPSLRMLPFFSILAGKKPPGSGAVSNGSAVISEAKYSITNLAHMQGRSTAGYFNSPQFSRFIYYGAFDHIHSPGPGPIHDDAYHVVKLAANDIISFQPDLCLLHLGCAGHVGYRAEIMSQANLKHVAMSDKALGILLKSLSLFGLCGQYHIIVTSDFDPGQAAEENNFRKSTVPWVAFGSKIRRGCSISHRVSVLDTAPTIANLMRLPPLASWEGKLVEDIILDQLDMADLEQVA